MITCTASGIVKLSPTSTEAADANRSRKGTQSLNTWAEAVSMWRLAFLEGGTFISARRLRMALMASITIVNCCASVLNSSAGSNSGQEEIMMLSPSWGSACQISSVMKGIKGWSSFRVLDMT